MGLRDVFRRKPEEKRYSFEDWLTDMAGPFATYGFNGHQYTLPVTTTYGSTPAEQIDQTFQSYVGNAYAANGVVWACELVRSMIFSEARFQFRQMRAGRPGDLFGTSELGILENPWPNGTTGELLIRMMQDADLAGNFFAVRERMANRNGERLTRLQPDKVKIALSGHEYNAYVLGYGYYDTPGQEEPTEVWPLDEVCHWSPQPDPLASFRGMSWLTPVVRNVAAHNLAAKHKIKFFENGATPNMVVKMPQEVGEDEFNRFREKFRERYAGTHNAYETMLLGSGADVTLVGSTFEQMSFKVTQGADETIIAAAAGVPAVIVGISEGLQGSTLNTGNYSQARRRLSDGTMRPLWRSASAALANVVKVPVGADLWYDDRDIAFLREDAKDDAEIKQLQAATIRQLVDGGYKPDTVVDAVLSGDFSRLVHTGKLSVQLQEPGVQPVIEAKSIARPLTVVRNEETGVIERLEDAG